MTKTYSIIDINLIGSYVVKECNSDDSKFKKVCKSFKTKSYYFLDEVMFLLCLICR